MGGHALWPDAGWLTTQLHSAVPAPANYDVQVGPGREARRFVHHQQRRSVGRQVYLHQPFQNARGVIRA